MLREPDYGPLDTFARGKVDPGKVDPGKIRRNWDDIVRVVSSIYTGSERAYDVVTMLQRDGHPTAQTEHPPPARRSRPDLLETVRRENQRHPRH